MFTAILFLLVSVLSGVFGYALYEKASAAIVVGDQLWGMGWWFSSISKDDAELYRMVSYVIMAVAGVVAVICVVQIAKR